jgi:hypothetical protein
MPDPMGRAAVVNFGKTDSGPTRSNCVLQVGFEGPAIYLLDMLLYTSHSLSKLRANRLRLENTWSDIISAGG